MFGGDVGSFLSTALGIVTIATLAGLGLLRGTVTNLREQLKDEREARASDRQDHADAEIKHAQFKADTEARIAQLEADNAAYQRVITGEVHWVAIGERLEDLLALVQNIWNKLSGGAP